MISIFRKSVIQNMQSIKSPGLPKGVQIRNSRSVDGPTFLFKLPLPGGWRVAM